MLWNDNTQINTHNESSALAAKASVSTEVRQLISLKDRTAHGIESELVDIGIAPIAQRVIEDLALQIYVPSVGVVISLFRKARWVSAVLDVATYYTRKELPLLSEVCSRIFIHSSEDHFNHHIARIEDKEAAFEHLQAARKRILKRQAKMDGAGIDE